jgi:hypothetical protein
MVYDPWLDRIDTYIVDEATGFNVAFNIIKRAINTATIGMKSNQSLSNFTSIPAPRWNCEHITFGDLPPKPTFIPVLDKWNGVLILYHQNK